MLLGDPVEGPPDTEPRMEQVLGKHDQGSSNPLWLSARALGFAHEDAQIGDWIMSSRYGGGKLSLRFRSFKFQSWLCCVTLGKWLPSLSLFPHRTMKGLCLENVLEEMGLCRVWWEGRTE